MIDFSRKRNYLEVRATRPGYSGVPKCTIGGIIRPVQGDLGRDTGRGDKRA